MIIEQVQVTGMAVFCYIIADRKGGAALLVDPAGDFDKIFKYINKYDLRVGYVVNTHGHFDHTSGNNYVIEKTGAQLLIHEKDAKSLKSIKNRFLSGVSGGSSSPGPSAYLRHGDIIKVGSLRIRVIHTPGHSEGSICLYVNGNIFTGDTLFTEGMGRTDLPGGSYREIMNSIKNKILSLPDPTVIWPGHNYGRHTRSTVAEQKRIYMDF